MAKRRFPDRDPQLMIDLSRDQLSVQKDFVDAIDGKLGLFLGIASALVAILMGAVTVQTKSLTFWASRGVILSVAIYLLISVICLAGLWLRRWRVEVDASRVYRDHFTLDERRIGWELANTYASHYLKNRGPYLLKVAALQWASIGLVIQTVVLVVTLDLVLRQV